MDETGQWLPKQSRVNLIGFGVLQCSEMTMAYQDAYSVHRTVSEKLEGFKHKEKIRIRKHKLPGMIS